MLKSLRQYKGHNARAGLMEKSGQQIRILLIKITGWLLVQTVSASVSDCVSASAAVPAFYLLSRVARLNSECLSVMTDTNNISASADIVLYTQMEIIMQLEWPLGTEWLPRERARTFSV